MARKLTPVHPGEVLLEEFLKPKGVSQYKLAKDISVPPRRINEIVLGKRAVTATRPCACPGTWDFGALLAEPPGPP